MYSLHKVVDRFRQARLVLSQIDREDLSFPQTSRNLEAVGDERVLSVRRGEKLSYDVVIRESVERRGGENRRREGEGVGGDEFTNTIAEAGDDGEMTFRVESVSVDERIRFGNLKYSRFRVSRLQRIVSVDVYSVIEGREDRPEALASRSPSQRSQIRDRTIRR